MSQLTWILFLSTQDCFSHPSVAHTTTVRGIQQKIKGKINEKAPIVLKCDHCAPRFQRLQRTPLMSGCDFVEHYGDSTHALWLSAESWDIFWTKKKKIIDIDWLIDLYFRKLMKRWVWTKWWIRWYVNWSDSVVCLAMTVIAFEMHCHHVFISLCIYLFGIKYMF